MTECTRSTWAHGFCSRHYYRWKRYGDPLHVPPAAGRSSTKHCTSCNKDLPVTAFYAVTSRTGKLRGQCKKCMAEIKRLQRQPDWLPVCSRCGTTMATRSGPGRRLCMGCAAATYAEELRPNGSRRLILRPCSLCGGPKERFERGKLCADCRPWESYASNLRKFGLTPRDYELLLTAQGGVCAICGTPPTEERLSIDHDHSGGACRDAVRGLLCRECNYSRLPRFNEDPVLLRRAADYLTERPAATVLGIQA